MKKLKRVLPLLTSITLLSGPLLLLVACDNERDMTNLPNGKIGDSYKNRILFNFLGVNFNQSVSEQFKHTYSEGLDFVLKDVEGTIAQQKFYEFFHNKLHYSADTKDASGKNISGEANNAFTKLKDDIGLNLLTQKYLSGINTANSLDKISAADNNELLFQNEKWHQEGTSIFNYSEVPFYKTVNDVTGFANNPDQVFTPDELYKTHVNAKGENIDDAFDAQLAAIAKHPDVYYSNEIDKLLPNNANKWNSSAGINNTQKALDDSIAYNIPTYSKYLKRFQWWLRFRYQQYYQYEILPTLNQTLFTMSYILDNILDIKDEQGKPSISTQISNFYIAQLQDTNNWSKSNYNLSWNFTTNLKNAQVIDKKWSSNPPEWSQIIDNNDPNKKALNAKFFTELTTGNAPTISEIDPIFGINGFLSTDTNTQETGNWITIDGLHYKTNNNIATFTYSTPIYFLNLLQNLDFSFLMNNDESKKKDWTPINSNLIQKWRNSGNHSIGTSFSDFIKGGTDSTIGQAKKWDIFWQMLYSISASDAASKDSPAAGNFKLAAQNLFPTYIPKDNIYEEGFWNKVKEFYP